jgi:ubiquinone/menaquinone biosynthesis C-methylase UbiE
MDQVIQSQNEKSQIFINNDPYLEVLDDPSLPLIRRLDVLQKLDIVNAKYGVYKNFISGFAQLLNSSQGSVGNVSILEVGSGMGGVTREIAKWGQRNQTRFSFNLYDSQSDILEISQRYLETHNIEAQKILATPEHLSVFPDNSFDYVVSLHVIHHIQPIETAVRAINEMLRVARKGIYLVDFHRKFGTVGLFKVWNKFFGLSTDLSEDGIKSMKRAYDPKLLGRLMLGQPYYNKFEFEILTKTMAPYWEIRAVESIKPC